MTLQLRLVPAEPDYAMIDAADEEITERQKFGCNVYLSDIWPVALSAAPAITAEQVDELCRAMWGDEVHWWGADVAIKKGYATSTSVQWMGIRRDKDRRIMRRFLAALGCKFEGE